MGKFPTPGDITTPSIRNIGGGSTGGTTSTGGGKTGNISTNNVTTGISRKKYISPVKLLPLGYNNADIAEVIDKSDRYVITDKTAILAETGKSDIGWTEINLHEFVSPRTIAVNLLISFRDSGSAANNTSFSVGRNGPNTEELLVKGGHINDLYMYAVGVVACDRNKKITYRINASGSGTADFNMYLLGFYEYII